MKSNGNSCGEEGFMHFYAEIYQGRWTQLKAALEGIGDSINLRFDPAGGYHFENLIKEGKERQNTSNPDLIAGSGYTPPDGVQSILPTYHLDRASVLAAESLILPDHGRILDACAAPGGKSLVLASRMSPDSVLVANDLSADRRRRLRSVLDMHLPKSLRCRIDVTGQDASSLCRRYPETFGAILLDVPCSSERHVLADSNALKQWSPARSKNLAFRQWSLLSSAFIMLAPGGCLVYSTCSISPGENDGVSGRLAEKYPDQFYFLPSDVLHGERTRFGTMIMPDTSNGSGPIYMARVFKHPRHDTNSVK